MRFPNAVLDIIRSCNYAKEMENVTFKPWVGKSYNDSGLYGLKILLLGESHYGEGLEDTEITKFVVENCGQGKDRLRFFTVTAKFILKVGKSRALTNHERVDFWDNVAFYNFVQKYVGNAARIRPSKELWQEAKQPFLEVVAALQPDLIVVLGKGLSYHLPTIPDGITVCKVNHPSSGFCYTKWMPKLEDAIEEATKSL